LAPSEERLYPPGGRPMQPLGNSSDPAISCSGQMSLSDSTRYNFAKEGLIINFEHRK
jgi:hypothetical protein